jgi:23S rRNA A2030 N6-methylase RlmJ
LKDSGLHTLYDLLRVQDRLGKGELRPEDLPERLRERVSLWSRAEVGPGDGQLGLLVKTTCLELMGRDGWQTSLL